MALQSDLKRKFMKHRKIYLMTILFAIIFISCHKQISVEYLEKIDLIKYYDSYVIILDDGCPTCKSMIYDFALNSWPHSTALIFKRKPKQETIKAYPDLFKKKYVFIDSLDISFDVGLTGKNSEITLVKKNLVRHFNFIEYESLISELEKE